MGTVTVLAFGLLEAGDPTKFNNAFQRFYLTVTKMLGQIEKCVASGYIPSLPTIMILVSQPVLGVFNRCEDFPENSSSKVKRIR